MASKLILHLFLTLLRLELSAEFSLCILYMNLSFCIAVLNLASVQLIITDKLGLYYLLLLEMHCSPLAGHLRAQKVISVLQAHV